MQDSCGKELHEQHASLGGARDETVAAHAVHERMKTPKRQRKRQRTDEYAAAANDGRDWAAANLSHIFPSAR